MSAMISWVIGEIACMSAHGKSTVIGIEGDVYLFRDEQGVVFSFDASVVEDKKPKEQRPKGAGCRARAIDGRLLHPKVIGFLASRAELFAEVRGSCKAWFEKEYKHPTTDLAGRLAYIGNNKWGEELRVKFIATDDEMVELGLVDMALPIKQCHGHYVINCNKFWWHLVGLGFRLGNKHDVNKIRDGIGFGGCEDFERWLTGKVAA